MPGVIRHDVPVTAPAFSFTDLEQRAAALLERAHQQAREIITAGQAQATKDGEAIRAKAHATGMAEGRKQGQEQARKDSAAQALKEARQEMTQLTAFLRTVLTRFEAEKRFLLATAEASLLRLALRIAGKVCHLAASESSDVALAGVREVLSLLRHEHDLTVYVNPGDLEALQKAAAETADEAGKLAHVRLLADSAVSRGGARLAGRSITVDATLETQLERIARALLPDSSSPAASESEDAS